MPPLTDQPKHGVEDTTQPIAAASCADTLANALMAMRSAYYWLSPGAIQESRSSHAQLLRTIRETEEFLHVPASERMFTGL